MHILQDLWHGRIRPCECHITPGSEYANLQQQCCQSQTLLKAILSQSEKELLMSIEDNQIKMSCISAHEAFVRGFRLGGQIMLATLVGEETAMSDCPEE